MIRGQVNAFLQGVLPVQLRDSNGQPVDLIATLDTGFSGYLTLPLAQITALSLPYDRTEIYTLGDNRDVSLDLYRGTIIWDGSDCDLFVLATESEPLVGTSLLRGFHLFIDFIDGGEVRIEARQEAF